MKVAIVEESVTVADSPPGLLLLDNGTVIVKTEYNEDSTPLHRCECYLVSSGERYWGDGDTAMARILVLLP